ncbi:IS3 family transposase [Parasediminibacterium sp. JCM 36343]|uniref:IS3 family transposase n=1 Tax=Parasediminibacterium sp. JCM 36343 TaxID=3374279 RepID=UPI0039785349
MPASKRCLMLEEANGQLSIVKQCGLLSLHRSRFYYVACPETADNLAIMRWLDEQYFSTPFYGVLRLCALLRQDGYQVNVKRARRLMKLVGWETLYREPRTTVADKASYKYPYLLKGLAITHRDKVWEVDITYLPMAKGFMYLYAVIDVYTRFIVGWGISNSMDAAWCASITQEAIEAHGKPEIINSDQGSQFTSEAHVGLLKSHEIKISMDGKGRAIDNIYIERFWRSIKYEDIYLKAYENGLALYGGVSKYMHFYNTKRVHQSLGYATPEALYKADLNQ